MTETVALALAYLLDLIIGDPRWIPHPVRGIGWAIEKVERSLRNSISCFEQGSEAGNKKGMQGVDNETRDVKYRINLSDMVPSFLRKGKKLSTAVQEKLAGVILVITIVGATYVSFYFLSNILLSPDVTPIAAYISFAFYVYLVSTTIATRGLLRSAQAVIQELKRGDVENSRLKLSMIVGRDTDSLTEAGVLRATIETLSENASDGIVAPLFYFVLGGLPLAMTYKAVNTLDSMVGYKKGKYKNFGWAAARLDDIFNYIPARITGLLIVAASYFINLTRYVVSEGSQRFKTFQNRAGRYIMNLLNRFEERMEKPDFERAHNAIKIMRRDGKKHSSPNSGIPEAAMAGALGIRLGGPSTYGGVKVRKPYIGDDIKKKDLKIKAVEIYMEAALSAVTITKLTSFFGFFVALVII